MGVQLRMQISFFDQPGQSAGAGCLNLATIFTQLRRDPGQPQPGVNFFFCSAADLSAVLPGESLIGERKSLF